MTKAPKNLRLATAKQKEILARMHATPTDEKLFWDAFDFPGTCPSVFDELKNKFWAVEGNHRGFTISKRGANFAAKQGA